MARCSIKEIILTSNTEFLVRTDDVGTGSYVSWKGYTVLAMSSPLLHRAMTS